ncbi:MAG TPA: serine hydrolase domain-containing protein [Jatrophihabitans sp.]|nr:serine hydrolase domain-containing protein [Jatrophihabitans sp.]
MRPLANSIRRVRIPRDLRPITCISDREIDPREVGMTLAGVQRIWTATERLFRRGMSPAITLCVRRHGQVVVDRSLGWARGGGPLDEPDAERVLATPETPFCIFSSSKAVTATVMHLLAERGVIGLNDRVTDYLPEFGGGGRDSITIAQVLSHRAGIPQLPRDALDLERLEDPERILEAIPRLRSVHRPGAAVAYHTVSGGFVLGEVVRRATGADIRTVLGREILDPLGFRWMNYGVEPRDVAQVGLAYPTGLPLLPPMSTLMTRALGLPFDELTALSNDPRLLTGIVPAGNVVATANEMSRFMDLLRAGGTLDGVTVLQPRTIRRAIVETSYHQIDRTLGFPVRYSHGFMLGARALSLYGPDTNEAFGHLGFTNICMWADPRRELAVGFITSGKPVLGPHLDALWRLFRQIGVEAPKVEEPDLYVA